MQDRLNFYDLSDIHELATLGEIYVNELPPDKKASQKRREEVIVALNEAATPYYMGRQVNVAGVVKRSAADKGRFYHVIEAGVYDGVSLGFSISDLEGGFVAETDEEEAHLEEIQQRAIGRLLVCHSVAIATQTIDFADRSFAIEGHLRVTAPIRTSSLTTDHVPDIIYNTDRYYEALRYLQTLEPIQRRIFTEVFKELHEREDTVEAIARHARKLQFLFQTDNPVLQSALYDCLAIVTRAKIPGSTYEITGLRRFFGIEEDRSLQRISVNPNDVLQFGLKGLKVVHQKVEGSISGSRVVCLEACQAIDHFGSVVEYLIPIDQLRDSAFERLDVAA